MLAVDPRARQRVQVRQEPILVQMTRSAIPRVSPALRTVASVREHAATEVVRVRAEPELVKLVGGGSVDNAKVEHTQPKTRIRYRPRVGIAVVAALARDIAGRASRMLRSLALR